MKKSLTILFFILYSAFLFAQDCIRCHNMVTPGIVTDWELINIQVMMFTVPIATGAIIILLKM
jgi:hypothetical protein